VEDAAKFIELAIRDTQKRASARVKPEGFCSDPTDSLLSYSIEIGYKASFNPPLTSRQFRITARCSDTTVNSQTFELRQEAMIEKGVRFDFDLMGQPSNANTVCVIDSGGSLLFEIGVEEGGAIEFGFSNSSCQTS
jgi:hypothetical protein